MRFQKLAKVEDDKLLMVVDDDDNDDNEDGDKHDEGEFKLIIDG